MIGHGIRLQPSRLSSSDVGRWRHDLGAHSRPADVLDIPGPKTRGVHDLHRPGFRNALDLFGQAGDLAGQAHTHLSLEADHSQLKRRLRPMRHLRNDRTATVIIQGHAFVQNLRRGHYQLTTDVPRRLRLAEAFDELSHAI